MISEFEASTEFLVEIAKDNMAFANTNGGHIIFGIKDQTLIYISVRLSQVMHSSCVMKTSVLDIAIFPVRKGGVDLAQ